MWNVPLIRTPGAPLPCGGCPKSGQPDTPRPDKDLSDTGHQIYAHYLECKAVGQWPKDGLVLRNAALIRQMEDAMHRQQLDLLPQVLSLIAKKP